MKKLFFLFLCLSFLPWLGALEVQLEVKWENTSLQPLILEMDTLGQLKEISPISTNNEFGITTALWELTSIEEDRVKIYVQNKDYLGDFSDWSEYSWLDYVEVKVNIDDLQYSLKPSGGLGAVWFVGELFPKEGLWIPVNQVVPLMNTVYGLVKDSSTGLGIKDVIIQGSSTNDAILIRDKTSESGLYLGFVDEGEYTVQFTRRGFLPAIWTLPFTSPPTPQRMDVGLSPSLTPLQMRVVLNWDHYPEDLNLILRGTDESGESIYLEEGVFRFYREVAFLELIGNTEFASESIVLEDWKKGNWKILVRAVSINPQSRIFSYSKARIMIFLGDGETLSFTIPEGNSGDLWEVADLIDGVLEPVNTLVEMDEIQLN